MPNVEISSVRLDYYTTLNVYASPRSVDVRIHDYKDGNLSAPLNVKQAEKLVADLQQAIKVAKGESYEKEL